MQDLPRTANNRLKTYHLATLRILSLNTYIEERVAEDHVCQFSITEHPQIRTAETFESSKIITFIFFFSV